MTHLGFAAVVPVMVVIACGGGAPRGTTAVAPEAVPSTVAERMLAMLPQGAQVVVELDLARLRENPVIGEIVTRALSDRTVELPAGVPAPPLAAADQVVLAAYGVGTAEAATLTVLAARHDVAGATQIADGFYVVGPPAWVEQVQARVALATTGEARFAIHAAPELLELRRHAVPANAPGASLRIAARLSFDARLALARQTGLDAAPAQLSAWGDVADDLVLVVDCDATDPGNRPVGRHGSDAPRRLAAALRGVLAAVSEQPIVRALGLPSSLAGARLAAHGSWVRTIIAIGPAHLRRVVERARVLLRDLGSETPSHPEARPTPPAITPRGDHAS
ncbi:MAG TPA: hypothetical protein VHN14_27945 [Kofleriaceae bacterium]|nr:hypothetical protein [Kofleriaceae bacterium]